MTDHLLIRRGEQHEIPELADIWLEGTRCSHGFIPEKKILQVRDYIAREHLPKATIWVAEKGGNILGYASVKGDYLTGLFVRRQAQGEGIGRRLLYQVLDRRRKIRLEVYQKNEPAFEFYRRQGFVPVETGTDPQTGFPHIVMEWEGKPTCDICRDDTS